MTTQNVTLALPKQTPQRAKLIAVKRQTSLSRLLTGLIEHLVRSEESSERSRSRHLALSERGYELGTLGRASASRDELHER